MYKLFLKWLFISFFITSFLTAQEKSFISGKIISSNTGEPLPNCNVQIVNSDKGAISNEDGNYEMSLEPGTYKVKFSYVGFRSHWETISVYKNQIRYLDVELEPVAIEQNEVTVTGEKELLTVSSQKLDIIDVKKMPTIYNDPLRSVKILPGVTSNNELSSSYNVRGGNLDENLIYLNGYEIFRPFLLKQGVEESQSLVNADMVKSINFYGGGFPANFGDKMSSALEVKYDNNFEENIKGTARFNLLNSGLTMFKKFGNFSAVLGVRYAYPSLFVEKMQTEGNYSPEFKDLQFLTTYSFDDNTELELSIIIARNKYKLVPDNWEGHFQKDFRFNVEEIQIDYAGNRFYNYNTELYGLKFSDNISNNFNYNISLAKYYTKESEKKDISANIYYNDNPEYDNPDLDYLKNRFERADNYLKLSTYELKGDVNYQWKSQSFVAGFNVRLIDFENKLAEYFFEEGDSILTEKPLMDKASHSLNMNTYSVFLQDIITFGEHFQTNLGLRYTRYDFTEENLISPRMSFHWYPNNINKVKFSAGVYYQPPFFYELKNKLDGKEFSLNSQKSIHYILGWEHQFKKDLFFNAEIYYKDLDDIIPYHIEQLNLVYGDENSHEGYAYGIDLMLKGEISDGLNSWFSYSYLDTKEQKKGAGVTKTRRLLDQTHTLQIFLQDKMRKNKNIQSHVRLLLGSGFLYHPRRTVYNEDSEMNEIAVNYDVTEKFTRFMRVDMGLSAKFNIADNYDLLLTAEVLNVFNNYNVATYNWYQILPSDKGLVKVPQIYTKRFFNVGAEISF